MSPDGNGYPDECDLAIPPGFAGGSLDCNTNGIPDECEIAACESDPACGDCNSNGIPDACDIAAEISTDTDTDGIPDECEEESLMGGEGDQSEAWEAFYDWAVEQCWGPSCEDPMDVQFAALVAKLQELGLPVRGHPRCVITEGGHSPPYEGVGARTDSRTSMGGIVSTATPRLAPTLAPSPPKRCRAISVRSALE